MRGVSNKHCLLTFFICPSHVQLIPLQADFGPNMISHHCQLKIQFVLSYPQSTQQRLFTAKPVGAQWLSGRVLDSRPKGSGLKPHGHHCVVSLSKNINPSLVLVQPRKTRPYITERLLMGRKESNQTNKQTAKPVLSSHSQE